MPKTITTAQFGLGPIGMETVKLLAHRPWARIVGGVDIDPHKIGKNLTELTGVSGLQQAKVHASFAALWGHVQPQVLLHTAGSNAQAAIDQIEPVAKHGVSVVSSCEQLAYPRLKAPQAADRLDATCRQHGARVVGAGVNPGFVMDMLPISMTVVSRHVERIHARRVVNASTRRRPLQAKIGSGMDPVGFYRLFEQGRAGHAGFSESAALIAHGMGWTLDRLEETLDPVIAHHDIKTEYFEVRAGQTAGLHQVVKGMDHGKCRIVLDLKMVLDAPDPHDLVKIDGDPPLHVLIRGGVPGDQATVAALVNAVPRLLQAAPGLHLMSDLALGAWR